MKKINVLMCGSHLSVKGGMISVVKNYLESPDWDEVDIKYVPTHIEKNKIILILFFVLNYIKIICLTPFCKFKIVHLHTAERGSFYRKAIILRTMKMFGVKTIMHHHAAEFEKFYSELSDKKKKYVNKILEMADMNIVLSKTLISMITDKAPNAKVSVLYNAVNTFDKNKYNINANKILFLGRLGERKGIYDLLQAIHRLDNVIDKNIKFYLCGDGDIEKVKNKINELSLNHRIEYVGWIGKEEKAKILPSIMINVLPSYNEGLPMSILETMSYGIPNISTNIASIPEVINTNENGYLINPGDIDSLTKYLQLLIENTDVRAKFSKNSYQLIANNFSLNNNIKELTGYYNELIEGVLNK